MSAAGLSGGACSWLYDSDKLPSQPDGGIDAPIDPCAFEIEEASPPALLEGWGDGEGRPALLVVKGVNLAQDATIKLTPTNATDAPLLDLVGAPQVSSGGSFLAVQVAVHVDPALKAGTSIPLTVTVSQACAGAPTDKSKAELVQINGYNELTAAPADGLTTAAPNVYSMIQVAGLLTIKANQTAPLILRSNSSLELGSALSVSANNATGGPGGATGGPVGAAGGGPGRGDGAKMGGLGGGNGGAAGYAAAAEGALGGPMTGDPLITSYTTNQGSGGGGGVALLGAGAGGGGGGTVEVTARGATKIANLTAVGGAGAGSGSFGGGGSGGTIVVRGSAVTAGTLDVSGGPSGSGNKGAAGRIRIDTPNQISATVVPANSGRRGGTFPADTPAIITEDKLQVSLLGTSGTKVDVRVLDRDRQTFGAPITLDFQGGDVATARVPLQLGYNLVCALPQGSSISVAESANCIEVARLAR